MTGARGVIVLGACGGVGASTLALGLAMAEARAGRPCTLLELDLARSDLAGALAVPPERTLADLAPVIGELRAEHVEAAAYQHRSGVRILFGPARPGDIAWGGREMIALCAVLAEHGGVVVDAAGGWGGMASALSGLGLRPLVLAPRTRQGARRAAAIAGAVPEAASLALALAGRGDVGAGAMTRMSGLPIVGRLPAAPGEAEVLALEGWPARGRARLARAISEIHGVLEA